MRTGEAAGLARPRETEFSRGAPLQGLYSALLRGRGRGKTLGPAPIRATTAGTVHGSVGLSRRFNSSAASHEARISAARRAISSGIGLVSSFPANSCFSTWRLLPRPREVAALSPRGVFVSFADGGCYQQVAVAGVMVEGVAPRYHDRPSDGGIAVDAPRP